MTDLAEQFPIGTVATLTGVNPITLRAWERRYRLLDPVRTAGGHRMYTHGHVERVRRVLALAERGVPIGRVRELLDADDKPKAGPHVRGPWVAYLDRMLAAVERFDEIELDRIHEEALSVHSIQRVTRQLIVPLLIRLGARWKDLPGAIAEEHFFATYLRSKLGARLHHRMRHGTGPGIVAACAPGEHHEIGLLLFALEACDAGLRPVVLGADTPLPDVAHAQRVTGSEGIVISSSVAPAREFLERALPALVRQAGVPVFVGGSTAVAHRQQIAASGGVALGVDVDDGVRLIAATLSRDRPRRPA